MFRNQTTTWLAGSHTCSTNSRTTERRLWPPSPVGVALQQHIYDRERDHRILGREVSGVAQHPPNGSRYLSQPIWLHYYGQAARFL